MTRLIIKIQRPLESSEVEPPALVYTEDRSYQSFVEFTKELRQAMGEREKVYCEVKVKKGDLELIRWLPPQEW